MEEDFEWPQPPFGPQHQSSVTLSLPAFWSANASGWFAYVELGLGTEFRSEKIPRNRLGTVSAIPWKKVLIPRHSEFRGRASSEAQNGTERNSAEKNMIPTVDMEGLLF